MKVETDRWIDGWIHMLAKSMGNNVWKKQIHKLIQAFFLSHNFVDCVGILAL